MYPVSLNEIHVVFGWKLSILQGFISSARSLWDRAQLSDVGTCVGYVMVRKVIGGKHTIRNWSYTGRYVGRYGGICIEWYSLYEVMWHRILGGQRRGWREFWGRKKHQYLCITSREGRRTREEAASIIQDLPRMTVPTKRLRVTLVKVVNLWNTTNDSQCSSKLLQWNTHTQTAQWWR